MITKEKFKQATGREPVEDDMVRVNCCLAGELGHRQCGWCDDCDQPKYGCECKEVEDGV